GAQRLAKEQWHLGGVGAARWIEEAGRVGEQLAVPADGTGGPGQQAEQGAQQGGLAAADPAGDHGERAKLEPQIDAHDRATTIWVAVGQPAGLKRFKPL